MYDSFKAICLTHHNASVEVREKFALSEKETQDFLLYLKDIFELNEALVVSTCNRTEIYYHSERELNEAILQALVAFKGDSSLAKYIKSFQIFEGIPAIEHLFEVSLGLNSQILGDIQIINQVKKAYQYSADLQLAGAFLHRLLHSIFFTNKRIAQETSFRDGAASIAYAAVELLQSIQMLWENPQILVLGLGEIGTDVCKNLQGKFNNVKICNRTTEKAEILAQETGFAVAPFADIWQEIQNADVVISSVAVPNFIHKACFTSKEILKQKYFIDLSVPRSVSLDLEEIAGFLVYDIDHLEQKTQETLQRRQAEIPAVRAIMQEAINEFLDWSKEMEISPVIQKIKNALEQIRKEELSKYSKKISEQEAELLDKITGNLMQKILKFPVLQLKAACKRGEADTLIDVLSELFDLEKAKLVQK
ncbi:glutamyl-tRNA reductase [Raineya orbicola]|uniref:Glutamyl-tRNA reductase n=1 Tax=Raineya orbicola TaxID=2016530 RepID=A0A2N3IG89_9BACT|nr:glutamyl-tRNA reductase [Raineya orbicola]PKQ69307.1 hemA: glutamyl-tRNA reductase [Raineya orbicola]